MQTKAHPRLKSVFEDGNRRCDYEAVVDLFFEIYGDTTGSVSAFYDVAVEAGWIEACPKQMAYVLKQMADQGKLYCVTRFGKYFYGKPRDGVGYTRLA